MRQLSKNELREEKTVIENMGKNKFGKKFLELDNGQRFLAVSTDLGKILVMWEDQGVIYSKEIAVD